MPNNRWQRVDQGDAVEKQFHFIVIETISVEVKHKGIKTRQMFSSQSIVCANILPSSNEPQIYRILMLIYEFEHVGPSRLILIP